MEIRLLDKDFNHIGKPIISYTNLQWTSKWFTFGTFSVQLPLDDWDINAEYIYSPDRREVGIITKVNYTNSNNQKQLQVSGNFLEYLLTYKIIYPQYSGTGNLESSIRDMVQTYKDDFTNLDLYSIINLNEELAFQAVETDVSTKIYELLKPYELSYIIDYDYVQNKMMFGLKQGRDLTQNQSVNNFVTFSTGFKNLNSINASIDNTMFKNFIIVTNNDKQIVTVDKSNGGVRRKYFFNAGDITGTDNLQTAGEQELINVLKPIISTRFDAKKINYEYLKDFEVGDLISIIVEELGVNYNARITEVSEVFKRGSHLITIQVGDERPTFLQKEGLQIK